MECCAKREKCLYMHSDFPCKFYYLGMTDHDRSTCKFAHGRPLTDQLRNILLKHLETAPKEILGDFRRINRDKAVHMLGLQHQKLLVEFGMAPTHVHSVDVKGILEEKEERASGGRRPTRWCDQTKTGHNFQTQNQIADEIEIETHLTSLRSLEGIISNDQIARLVSIGVESVDQINQMTVAQLNEIGLSISQIHEIQLNALQVQNIATVANDFDMRLQPNRSEPNQPFDVDMRLLPDKDTPYQATDVTDELKPNMNPQSAYDYSQYVKDSHIGADDDEKLENEKIETDSKNDTVNLLALPLPAVYDPSSALYPSSIANKIDLSSSVTHFIKETSPQDIAPRCDPRDTEATPVIPDNGIQVPMGTTFEFFNRPVDDSAAVPCSLDQLLPDKSTTPLSIPSDTTFGIYDYSPTKSNDVRDKPSFSPPSYSPWASSSTSNTLQSRTTTINLSSINGENSPNETADYDDEDFMEDDDDEPENQYRVADAIFANVTSFSSRDKDMRMPSAPLFQNDKFSQRNGDVDLRLPFKPVMANYIPAKEIDASFGSHPLISYKVLLIPLNLIIILIYYLLIFY